MNKEPIHFWLYVLIVLCVLVGWIARGVIENREEKTLQGAMAWGYDEAQNVWNRIRVDEKGHVLCSKNE